MDFHGHIVGMTRQNLVNSVVHDLIDHMVQTGPIIRIADIHAGAFTHSFQALENLDGIRAVFVRLLGVFDHACLPWILPTAYRCSSRVCHASATIFRAQSRVVATTETLASSLTSNARARGPSVSNNSAPVPLMKACA